MAKRELVDALGIPFAEHHKWLPPRAADFPRPKKIVDKEAAWQWKLQAANESHFRCWWCIEKVPGECKLECHHMVRHDTPFAFALLCPTCHRHTGAAVHASSLPRLLWLKWKYDSEHTSWIFLAIGLNRFLPEPSPPTPESRA